ncbi:fms-related tyrosine kinase 3 ligand [Heteronotia binoei]|uniref:fms-related tyrosine kinase 3 ligand n=1 Tax=Heteronotia binoei TaxID=13085 RepID=UPI00292ECEB5|nr:fms-related tyrosine kinase 3 ligand [Heteronotia binoei]
MSRYHGIPDASVVSLLLFLCFTHSGLGKNCTFSHEPLPTTGASKIIELKKLLLLDYPVSLPSNLKTDEYCVELWQLHIAFKELNRMQQVAGSELREKIAEFRELNLQGLFDNCTLESDCVEFEKSNISVFMDSIHSNFEAMTTKITTSLNFSNCTRILCQSGSLRTPYPGYSPQLLKDMQASKSAIRRHHYWLLILLPLLLCLFCIVKFSGRVPFQPSLLQE